MSLHSALFICTLMHCCMLEKRKMMGSYFSMRVGPDIYVTVQLSVFHRHESKTSCSFPETGWVGLWPPSVQVDMHGKVATFSERITGDGFASALF